MIFDIATALAKALKAKGCPLPLSYGPSPVPTAIGASRVYVMRDIDAGDQVLAARSQHKDPRVPAVRAIGALVRIFAKSTIENAQRHDHEDLADLIVDAVQVETYKIVRGVPTEWRVTRAGFTTDLAVTDGWAGVVYELHFQVDRGVRDVDWKGLGPSTMTMTKDTVETALAATGPGVGTALPTATTEITS